MQVYLTDFAVLQLQLISEYRTERHSHASAQKIIRKLFKTILLLEDFPEIGKLEPKLKKLNQKHRFIIEGDFKIIYRVHQKKVLITDIFECHQHPGKIRKRHFE